MLSKVSDVSTVVSVDNTVTTHNSLLDTKTPNNTPLINKIHEDNNRKKKILLIG